MAGVGILGLPFLHTQTEPTPGWVSYPGVGVLKKGSSQRESIRKNCKFGRFRNATPQKQRYYLNNYERSKKTSPF